MKKIFLIVLAVVSVTALISCKKAGLGGDATIVAFPKHHGKAIYGATVFVKFNTKDSPGADGNYDATFTGETNEDHVHLEELKQGDYYFYAVGFDSTIKQTVYGGQSFTIKRKDKSEEQDVDIAVVE